MGRELSISRAWEETKARIARDGRLFVAVALALVALPSAIGQVLNPNTASATNPPSITGALVVIIVAIIGMIGQLAMIRLALTHGISVAEAIGHGAGRVLSYLGSAVLILLAATLILLPFGAALAAMGVPLEPGSPPPPATAWLIVLAACVLLVWLAIRMMLTSAVASAESAGPITIIKRSWQLTRGHTGRLLGFLLLFVIGALVVVVAVSIVVGGLVTLLLGPREPGSIAALLIILVEAVTAALVTILFLVMLARIYVQLIGDDEPVVSVPSSGT